MKLLLLPSARKRMELILLHDFSMNSTTQQTMDIPDSIFTLQKVEDTPDAYDAI